MSAQSPPPPPPKIPPVTDVDVARRSVTSVTERLEGTMLRASSFAEDARHRRVGDEWSTVESLRHMVLVLDLWLSRNIRGEQDPFHPIGLPPSFMPPKLPGTSIDPDASPTFEEACEVLRGRVAGLRGYIDALTREELDRPIEAHVGTVAGGLGVIFNELTAHDRFINRDLDTIAKS
jgi:hypothetical protein